jgi:hypothetical protein
MSTRVQSIPSTVKDANLSRRRQDLEFGFHGTYRLSFFAVAFLLQDGVITVTSIQYCMVFSYKEINLQK